MLSKLGISLNLTASVLSLTTWADAKDVKQLYRNEYAQIGAEQSGAAVNIPSFDEEGNPVLPADQLYPICFEDFQLYITQIDGIIKNISNLDDVVIPTNAEQVWSVTGTAGPDQDLQQLANEYTAAVGDGSWQAL